MPVTSCGPSPAIATQASRRAPATACTRSSARSRRRRGDRAPEALRAEGDGRPRRARCASRPASRRSLPWRVSVIDALGAELARRQGQGPRSTGPGTPRCRRLGHPLADRSRRRYPGGGTLRQAGRQHGPARDHGRCGRPGDDQPERRRCRRRTTITYMTTQPRRCRRPLLDAAGAQMAELASRSALQPAGEHTITFDGLGQPDGVYTVVLTASRRGRSLRPRAAPDHA